MEEEANLPLLKYRIIGASTEDPENPFYSIISGLKNDGWASVRYCTYPQELLIQICRPCRLRQIHLVFHEYKIPTKLEFYYFFPKTFNDFNLPIDDIIFEKMGHIIPSSNIKNKFKSRELRKIFINENVYYLKLVFHQNYSNTKNLFNQVGLVSLQCYGVDFSANNINGLYPSSDQIADFYNNKVLFSDAKKKVRYNDSTLDEVCVLKIQELKEILDQSIKQENYDLAKQINDTIQIVRKIGEKINLCIDMKNKALEINDFDTCKNAKNDIEILREKVRRINVSSFLGDVSKPIQGQNYISNINMYGDDNRPLNVGLNSNSNNLEDESEVKVDTSNKKKTTNVNKSATNSNKEQASLNLRSSEYGDDDESVRETVKYKK